MKIFYDTEFLEDGRTIELISIGMVREDGREYYAVNADAPWKAIRKHTWLMDNVIPSLPRIHGDERNHLSRRDLGIDFDHPAMKPRQQIAAEVKRFVLGVPNPQLWAWYGAYDHVVVCQLFGRMIDLPSGFPMFTCDLKQEAVRLGNPQLPEQRTGAHNALADARHLKLSAERLARHMATLERTRAKAMRSRAYEATYNSNSIEQACGRIRGLELSYESDAASELTRHDQEHGMYEEGK